MFSVGISIWSIIGVHRYNKGLAELYDTSDESSADDIGQVLTFIIFTAVVTLLRVLLPESLTSTILVSGIFAIFLSVLQYYIGSLTYRMKDTSEIAAEIESPDYKIVQFLCRELQKKKPLGGHPRGIFNRGKPLACHEF